MMWQLELQLKNSIIRPTLSCLDLNSAMLTNVIAAIGLCPKPRASRDCFGLYAMTHDQHWALWDDYLVANPALASDIRGLASQHQFLKDPDQELNGNLSYATVIAAFWLQMHLNTPLEQNDPLLLLKTWYLQMGYWQPKDYRQLMDTYHRLNGNNAENVA